MGIRIWLFQLTKIVPAKKVFLILCLPSQIEELCLDQNVNKQTNQSKHGFSVNHVGKNGMDTWKKLLFLW